MYDLVIIGAGPAGIALAAKARAVGRDASSVLVLEKGTAHNCAIRQFYPAHKKTTTNYKGHVAQCEGLLCITDMTSGKTNEPLTDDNLSVNGSDELAFSGARANYGFRE
jgi:thioredoxin reductase